jgi:WD40 repeat protein
MKVQKIDTFSGHRGGVYSLVEGESEHEFFSAGADGMVVYWNLQKPDLGKLVAQVPASVYALAYDKAQKQLWVAQNYEGIHVIDPDTKAEVKSLKITSSTIFDLKFFENNAYVATSDGTIIVIDIEVFAVKKHLKASDRSVRTLAFNEQTKELAAGYSDFTIKIFDTSDFSLKKVIEAHQNSVFCLQYSPNYQYLLSGSRDAHLKIWNVPDYTLHQDIVAHLFAINHIVFSDDGQYFATCSMDKSVKVWASADFKLRKVIDKARHAGHGTSVNKLWWSSYKNLLLSASDDRMISIWELDFE